MSRNILVGVMALIVVVIGGYVLWSRTPTSGLISGGEYYSVSYGISFSYPESYVLTEHEEGTAERMMHSIILVDKADVLGGGMEGPPSITVTVFQNREGYTLEEWIRGSSFSNFKLSSDQKISSTTIMGQAALMYQYSGLYETDAVAVSYGGNIYLFSAGWITAQDAVRNDLKSILSTVTFISS